MPQTPPHCGPLFASCTATVLPILGTATRLPICASNTVVAHTRLKHCHTVAHSVPQAPPHSSQLRASNSVLAHIVPQALPHCSPLRASGTATPQPTLCLRHHSGPFCASSPAAHWPTLCRKHWPTLCRKASPHCGPICASRHSCPHCGPLCALGTATPQPTLCLRHGHTTAHIMPGGQPC